MFLLLCSCAYVSDASAGTASVSVGEAIGMDSNLYFADDGGQNSLFVHSALKASYKTDPSRSHRLSLGLGGQLYRYLEDSNANRVFADATIAYRYSVNASLLIGAVEAVSYTKMQLIDTEGDTLPGGLFKSWNQEPRVYAQLVGERLLVTLSIGLRLSDIEDTFGADHGGYFSSLELAGRWNKIEGLFGYEYSSITYDELSALEVDGAVPAQGPNLELSEHLLKSRVQWSPGTRFMLGLAWRGRWVDDTYVGDRSFGQFDVTPTWSLRLPSQIVWDGSVGRRYRVYSFERVGRGEERFWITETAVRKGWSERWSSSLTVQYTQKLSSPDPSGVDADEFRDLIYVLGLKASF